MSIKYVALTEEDQRALKRTQLEQNVLTARNDLRAIETQHYQASNRDPVDTNYVAQLEEQHADVLDAVRSAESELAEFSQDGS